MFVPPLTERSIEVGLRAPSAAFDPPLPRDLMRIVGDHLSYIDRHKIKEALGSRQFSQTWGYPEDREEEHDVRKVIELSRERDRITEGDFVSAKLSEVELPEVRVQRKARKQEIYEALQEIYRRAVQQSRYTVLHTLCARSACSWRNGDAFFQESMSLAIDIVRATGDWSALYERLSTPHFNPEIQAQLAPGALSEHEILSSKLPHLERLLSLELHDEQQKHFRDVIAQRVFCFLSNRTGKMAKEIREILLRTSRPQIEALALQILAEENAHALQVPQWHGLANEEQINLFVFQRHFGDRAERFRLRAGFPTGMLVLEQFSQNALDQILVALARYPRRVYGDFMDFLLDFRHRIDQFSPYSLSCVLDRLARPICEKKQSEKGKEVEEGDWNVIERILQAIVQKDPRMFDGFDSKHIGRILYFAEQRGRTAVVDILRDVGLRVNNQTQ